MKKYILSLLSIVFCFSIVQAADKAEKGDIWRLPQGYNRFFHDQLRRYENKLHSEVNKRFTFDDNLIWRHVLTEYKRESGEYKHIQDVVSRRPKGKTPEAILDMRFKRRGAITHILNVKALLADKQEAKRIEGDLTELMQSKDYILMSWYPYLEVPTIEDSGNE